MDKFTEKAKEELGHYVYVLINPDDNKIFYVGKGQDDRVFAHINCNIKDTEENLKYKTIKDIGKSNVKHYIIRHGLDENVAYIVESVLIDFLTFQDFKSVATITNIVAGHHSFDRGIKSVEEIERLYNCQPIEKFEHKVLAININKEYGRKDKDSIYNATRASWILSYSRASNADLIFAEYHNIVREIYVPLPEYANTDNKWNWISHKTEKGNLRWEFDGMVCENADINKQYLNKSLPDRGKGNQNPIRYFNEKNIIEKEV